MKIYQQNPENKVLKGTYIMAAVARALSFFRSQQESIADPVVGNYMYTASANNEGPQNSGNRGSATGSAGAGGTGQTGDSDDTDGENKNDFASRTKSGDTDNPNTGGIANDPGTGVGGTDYVGKSTGKAIDTSVADTVTGGGTSQGLTGSSGGASTGGVTADDTNVRGTDKGNRSTVTGTQNTADTIMRENSGAVKKASDSDYVMVDPNKRITADDLNPTDENEPDIKSTERGTGTGAAMNNINEEDVDAGTGSSRRGNRAGVPDADTGTITGGTTASTGIDDAALGPER